MARQSVSSRLIAISFAVTSLSAVLASCASAPSLEDRRAARLEERGEQYTDAAISKRVAATIYEQVSLRDANIHVETYDNVVHLSGYVLSAGDAERAEKLALSIKDVRRVKDDLVVP